MYTVSNYIRFKHFTVLLQRFSSSKDNLYKSFPYDTKDFGWTDTVINPFVGVPVFDTSPESSNMQLIWWIVDNCFETRGNEFVFPPHSTDTFLCTWYIWYVPDTILGAGYIALNKSYACPQISLNLFSFYALSSTQQQLEITATEYIALPELYLNILSA